MTFADKLRKLATNRFANQQELAKAIGISKSTLARWYAGEIYPDLQESVKIANMFNTTVDYLAFDEIDYPHERLVTNTERSVTNQDKTEEEISIAALVKALGPKEALRRLTFTSAVEVLPNPELQEVVSGPGATAGPVRVNSPGMLEIGAFVVGKTTRVLYKSLEQLREFGEYLIGVADSVEEQEKLEQNRTDEEDAFRKELQRLTGEYQKGAIDRDAVKRSLKEFRDRRNAKLREILEAANFGLGSPTGSIDAGEDKSQVN